MAKISKDSTLPDIIALIGVKDKTYMINTMEEIDYSLIQDPNLQEQIRKMVQGRKFSQLNLEEMTMFYSPWNLDSMVKGLEYLANKANEEKVFYDIWEDTDKDETKEKTGLTVFPVKGSEKFVVICPGGGYGNVCSIPEGFPLAMALNQMGYSAFVLQYRIGENAKAPNPMDDLAQAVRFILNHANEWQIDTSGYAVLGFSAGGHLAASFGTTSLGYKKYGLPKPELMILGYPVITMGDKTHEGSREILLGSDAKESELLCQQYSIEQHIDKEYPPVYVWQCEADEVVPVENSRMLVECLKQQNISCMYEVFPGTAHGWGLGTKTLADGWLDRAVNFWKTGR
jgi:acetyl esterase/lipase